ncbi:MAG: Coenzyme F420 hydrogenase/dehydrogenase, beta subunit C-terminal domain [Novosphingobium sp.]
MTAAPSPTLARVLRGQLCSGCGLCAGTSDGAVTMEAVAPGYARPHQNRPIDDAIERKIAASCPGATVAPWPPAPHRHPYWGPWHACLTGHATDPAVRHAGSSGGAISTLAIHALRSGMVERVLHIAADPHQPTRNISRWSRSAEEILAGAGSRYAASSPLEQIDQALSEESPFLFIGKPCDVSALRRLATVDPRVETQVPVMLSFFCGGMPSHDGADRILHSMGLAPETVTEFRYRGNGWPGLTTARTGDGTTVTMRYAASWGAHLSKEVQFRCKICPDAVGGTADIACADAWYGGESGYPSFEEQDGRSLILTRTEKGAALLESAVRAGEMAIEELPITEIDLMQPSQARRKRLISARKMACAMTMQPSPSMAGLDVMAAAKQASVGEYLKNLLGTLRRIAINRR